MPSSASALPPLSPLFPYTTLFRSHDALTRMLSGTWWSGSALRRAAVAIANALGAGWLILDDVHIPKPYAKAIAFCGWDFDHAANRKDRKSTRLNSSHTVISYAVFCERAPAALSTLSLHDALPISRRPHAHAVGHVVVGVGASTGSRGDCQRPGCGLAHPRRRPYPEALRQGDRLLRLGLRSRREPKRSEEHTSELQSHSDLVCRLLRARSRRSLHSFPTRRSSDLTTPSRACCRARGGRGRRFDGQPWRLPTPWVRAGSSSTTSISRSPTPRRSPSAAGTSITPRTEKIGRAHV